MMRANQPSALSAAARGAGTWRPRLFGPGLLLLLAMLAEPRAHAQTGGPTPTTDPTAIPLDGGVSLLLAGGVGYAVRRLRRKRG